MMLPYLDSWLLGPRRQRVICGLVWGIAMAGLAALPSGPEEPSREGEREWAQQQHIRLRQMWLEEQNQPGIELPPVWGFSALRLAREGGGQVVSWQADDGKLVLSVNWLTLPRLFTRLAESDVELREFQLEPDSSSLRLTLRLEAER
ncbi:hypothetical protein GIX45_01410 [Erwinia sp. CPCC 100877]|nr:hypothetical protein [Erwinia sp. CPCC 100877]